MSKTAFIETKDILEQGFEEWEKEFLMHGIGLIKWIPCNGKLIRVKIIPTRRKK